jgi:ABC-type multidrug transport system fused ATPase/permease subunit
VLVIGIVLHRQGAVTAGTVFVLYRYSQMVRYPLERIAEQLREVQKALAGATRAAALLATEPGLEPGGRAALPDGPLGIDIDHVSFAYGDDRPVLHDLDLRIAPGSHLGVVGRTGSGKTTLGRLLLRLYDPVSGAVRAGGVDLRAVEAAALRQRIAVVTQDVQLFRASVRDNLTLFGALEASDDRLRSVLDELELGPWLAAQPAGLDTDMAGGDGLSAGEAQLVAFARAFLTDPGLVVLDEASSRLDPETEQRIALATDRLLRGRTAVIIAHRLATLETVDEILVLDGGRVLEHGARAALAPDPASAFARLVAAGTGVRA